MGNTAQTRSEAAGLHFHLWIGALNRALSQAVDWRAASNGKIPRAKGEATGLSTGQAKSLVQSLDRLNREGSSTAIRFDLSAREKRVEGNILADAPAPLPLQVLRSYAGLSDFELRALLVLAASELSTDYGRLFGYVVDDLGRTAPSIEAILALTDSGEMSRSRRRALLGPGHTLRRLGLVDADEPLGDKLTTRLGLAPGVFAWLNGHEIAPPVALRDPALLVPDLAKDAALLPDRSWRAASVLLQRSATAIIGMWGTISRHPDDVALHLAAASGLALYRCRVSAETPGWADQLRLAAACASACNAALWIETGQLLTGSRIDTDIADVLANLPARLIITGASPWRPAGLLAHRPYADIADCDTAPIAPAWPLLAGEADTDSQPLNEARHRLSWSERQAAANVARCSVRALKNGSTPPLEPALEVASRIVSAPQSGPSARLVEPRRTLDDLILPDALHSQIAEIARFHSAAGLVDRDWGFGRIAGSTGAVKVLFTGSPGTGKTLAAEVIAGLAGTALLKVDLSQVVSKWIGETEKNLEEVFNHAERSGATLFFDEADALFGKRGEVRHGTDRFANMEVSFLLQRLETFSRGLVILASNLRDEIDPAFARRFQVSLHFPKPERAERERLWHLALNSAPVSRFVRIEELAQLELTGGAIVGAARMAGLLAATEGCEQIDEEHLSAAIERQYRKEARLMTRQVRPSGLHIAQGRR